MSEINLKRRVLLQASAVMGLLAAAPRLLFAAAWPREAFGASSAEAALASLLGGQSLQASDQIDLQAPEIAENGAVVPISVNTTLDQVESISIVVEKNPRPLAASFEIPQGTLPDVAARIKMGETSDVIAVVKTANGTFSTRRTVKVTIGGCGG
jgi:sulfur-oxidizing protein SoxY